MLPDSSPTKERQQEEALQQHHKGRPESPEQLAALIAAMRAALVGQHDAERVHADLERGGEEGLTDMQLKR